MKKIMMIGVLLVAGFAANAQATAAASQHWEANGDDMPMKHNPVKENAFTETEMSVADGRITFERLPALKRATWAVITDANGEQMKQNRVTAEYNAMDIHRLRRGLYFVTLVYRDKIGKTFVLNL